MPVLVTGANGFLDLSGPKIAMDVIMRSISPDANVLGVTAQNDSLGEENRVTAVAIRLVGNLAIGFDKL